LIFVKGESRRKVSGDDVLNELKKEINLCRGGN